MFYVIWVKINTLFLGNLFLRRQPKKTEFMNASAFCFSFCVFLFLSCLSVLIHMDMATAHIGCLPYSLIHYSQTSIINFPLYSSDLESDTDFGIQSVSQKVINFESVTFDSSNPKSPPRHEK